LDSLIEPVKATGLGAGFLSAGISNDDNDFLISAPGQGHTGELKLSLVPAASGIVWPAHLNYDWNGDGNIDENDFPSAMINFGLFRGNDKIIQWRELSL
jgi:MSHA biogenesis protein MshQ